MTAGIRPSGSSMTLLRLWWTAMIHPARAFREVSRKPAPLWALGVVVSFNVAISLTTNLARVLFGGQPLLPSWLTFIPDDRYLLLQLFLLPAVRLAVWLLGAATVHLGIRLLARPSDLDLILQIGGVQYLVVMPYSFLVDWTTLACGQFGIGLIGMLHGTVDLLWSLALLVIGLQVLLRLRIGQALILALASTLVTLPVLALFAR